MIKFDAHLHVGNFERCSEIVFNSEYKNKYRVYSDIQLSLIRGQLEYLSTLEDFFAIPIIFREINITLENNFINSFCKNFGKGVPVGIINQFDDSTFQNFKIWKEHFLVNNYEEFKKRLYIYEYINERNGFIIIHCKDKIRVEYINFLHSKFPKINFIIAHLGRDVNENFEFIKNILQNFNGDHFYFDISTIKKVETIVFASKFLRSDALLYGSDYPYQKWKEIQEIYNIICGLDNATDILETNFMELRRRIG